MKKNILQHFCKHITAYRIAVCVSSASVFFGIFREFLIVGLLGFSSSNDRLQLYLSIFYTIGMSIDAMRLSSLNLYSVLSLPHLLFSASLIGLPFSFFITLIMSYATGGLDLSLLSICMLGSFLNLIAAMLITYVQRQNSFLAAQFINVLPNFILIPGILICYYFLNTNLVFSIVCLTSIIPVMQCAILLFLCRQQLKLTKNECSLLDSITTFLRHFAAMTGEQLFQIIIRSAFYKNGTGYLSIYAMIIRIYSALRFILIDTLIGSKLADWKKEFDHEKGYFTKRLHSNFSITMVLLFALMISLKQYTDFIYFTLQMIVILVFGFYFSTLVRIIYFKINRHENNSALVMQFALYEIIFACSAFLLTKQLNYPILAMLWIGYIVKPFAQLLLLRRKYGHGTSH